MRLLLFPDYYIRKRSIYLIDNIHFKNKMVLLRTPSQHFSINNYLKKSYTLLEFLFLINYCIDSIFIKIRLQKNFKLITFFLKIIKPKEVIVVCSYNKLTKLFIDKCNSLNIMTSELQHGHITKNHPFYTNQLGYLKKFYVWSDLYANNLKLTNPHLKFENIGFPINKNQELLSMSDTILILDQWTIRTKLVEITKKLAKNNPNHSFCYKLHPNKKMWPKENLFYNFSNVLVLKTKKKVVELNERFEKTIGDYSTGLIESKIRGSKCFIINPTENQILIDLNICDDIKNITFKNIEINEQTK